MGEQFKIEASLLCFGKVEKMGTFRGNTADASAPILSAKFWKKGTKIVGRVTRRFKTSNGDCYSIQLLEAISVNRAHTYPEGKGTEKLDKISVGSLKGFDMAVQASGVPNGQLLPGDKVVIECTGSTPTDKGNPQIDFSVEVNRDEF